jgi:hypothetical protein
MKVQVIYEIEIPDTIDITVNPPTTEVEETPPPTGGRR